MSKSSQQQTMRFSIVITCFNQRDFIRAAVDSALSQSCTDREIIVIDDGSDDGSLDVLKQYTHLVQLIIFRRNRGAIEARNHAASLASGQYLVFLDGDDALMPWALDVYQRLILERQPIVILGQSLWFEGDPPKVKRDDFPESITFVYYEALLKKDRPVGLGASTYVVERRCFYDVGGWSQGIFHLDLQDLSTKLGHMGPMVLLCSPQTALYRIHEDNTIHSVPPFLRMLHRLLAREKDGLYPGGGVRRFERYAWFGGLLIFWVRRAVRVGLYKDAARLVASGWLMIFASMCRRSVCVLRRRPIESLSS